MSTLRRAVPAKSSATTSIPTGAQAERVAEFDRRAKLLIQLLDGDKLSNFGTLEISLSHLELYTEALESVASDLPKDIVQTGRPGTKLLVTAINRADPNFPVRDREDLPELGEALTVPETVDFFVKGDETGDRTSATLIRYYLKQHQPFMHRGYTFRALDDFKRDLNGPAAKDFYELANIHAEWCKANQRTPFE